MNIFIALSLLCSALGTLQWSVCRFSQPTDYALITSSIQLQPDPAQTGRNVTMLSAVDFNARDTVSNITGGRFVLTLKRPDGVATNPFYTFEGKLCDLLVDSCPCPCSPRKSIKLIWRFPIPTWVGTWNYQATTHIYTDNFALISCLEYQSFPLKC